MSAIKEYLVGVITAAILCAIVSQLAGTKGFLGKTMKLITGVFMLLALIAPVANLKIHSPGQYFTDMSLQADHITMSAAAESRESVSEIIKERTQAYILDKANAYGAEVSVEVILSDGEIPQPESVIVTGSVSPYLKKTLSDVIQRDLGISTEAQIWN